MRGEEPTLAPDRWHRPELPPHARRREIRFPDFSAAVGITSACAEKRPGGCRSRRCFRNYLRMRGEEGGILDFDRLRLELPPHARRRVTCLRCLCSVAGITSACAEKSAPNFPYEPAPWNYLRMRGEEPGVLPASLPSAELPPHARRRGSETNIRRGYSGITSACAEKSPHHFAAPAR